MNHRVELSDNANGTVIADAVTFHDAAAPGNAATYTPTLTETGAHRLYARWPSSSGNLAADAVYTVYHDGGSTTVPMDQSGNGGLWHYLGLYNMTPGQNHRLELSDRASDPVAADAVVFEWTGLTPPTAAWTPSLARRDLYDVQAWWPSSLFQAPEALYRIVGEGGNQTVAVNQILNYNKWNTLAAGVIMDPAAGHKLELPGKASGSYVIADAARFLPSPTLPRNVTWAFTPSSTGAHLVYAKWPAAATHTTEAKFTIAHAGGSTDVTVNQRIQGGQWVLLGSFTMNASTAYTIALSDNPNGQVAADAVRVAPVAASAEKFTWTPTIPSSGSYDVYARWVASSANTGSATYTVTHAGGATNVVVNQKQNGGTWVKLGSYSFTPSSGHKIELSGAEPALGLDPGDGKVVADGLRLVAASAQAANIAYIHSDHLGSPQKMTDTSQALTWDGQFDPFGEEFLISGSAVQPNRFPGQYADAETGYSYNYYRDYDPTVGRYIQSDPIGLVGGSNLYAYVDGNTPRYSDASGLGNCTYSVSTHTLVCTSNDGSRTAQVGPDGIFSGRDNKSTGKRCRDNPDCSGDENYGPTPPGDYDMEESDHYPGQTTWWLNEGPFRRGMCKLGYDRCEFFLHAGTVSFGCITVNSKNVDAMKDYGSVKDILRDDAANGEDNNMTVVK